MPTGTTVEVRRFEEVVGSIRRALRVERNRTVREWDAFEAFANRITELQPSSRSSAWNSEHGHPQGGGGAATLQSTPVAGTGTSNERTTIRNAYEETVMSVPFYEAEYGDTYEESIQTEFGPEVATAMTQSDCFSPLAKQVLLEKIEQARTDRGVLLETCDRERDSVDDVAAMLSPLVEELQTIESIPFGEQGFDALAGHRNRLLTLENKCEHAAATRQATIHRHRTEYNFPVDAPDICVYLYSGLESAYPTLFLCTNLAQRIEEERHHVERALSTSP